MRVKHPAYGRRLFDAEGMVICHVCGQSFRSLGPHVPKHGFASLDEYRHEFGLSSRGLCCKETSAKLSAAPKSAEFKAYVGLDAAGALWNQNGNPQNSRSRETVIKAGRAAAAARRAATHCAHGHEFDEANTNWRKRGDGGLSRRCKACDRERSIRNRAKNAERMRQRRAHLKAARECA